MRCQVRCPYTFRTTTDILGIWQTNSLTLCPVVDVVAANLQPFSIMKLPPKTPVNLWKVKWKCWGKYVRARQVMC